MLAVEVVALDLQGPVALVALGVEGLDQQVLQLQLLAQLIQVAEVAAEV